MVTVDNEGNSLEKAICLKANAQFGVAIKAWEDRPFPEEQRDEYKKNIEGSYAPKSKFTNSEDITCKYYIAPLIEKIINIETELRASYKISIPPDRLEYLREFLENLVRSKWSYVVGKAWDDAEKHVIFHNGHLPEYKASELEELYTSRLKLDPASRGSRFSFMIDNLLQIAYAESLLHSQKETDKLSKDIVGQLGHSVVINNPQNINLNIANTISNVRQSINNIQTLNQAEKEDLEKLFLQLLEELQKAPLEKAQDAEAVAEYAKDLVEEVSKETPKKIKIHISKEGLIKAAENIASALPLVLKIAKQIVNHVLVSQ